MKKKLLILIICSLIFIPNVYAGANTLQDLKNELASLKQKRDDNKNARSRTQSEINNMKNSIVKTNSEIEKAKDDIQIAKARIEETNLEIEDMVDETKKLLVFYQIMSGESEVLEYISGATSYSDLFIRSDSVSQILNYNSNKLDELETLIEENKQLQIDLARKQIELNDKILEYQDQLSNLNTDLDKLVDMSLDIDDEIAAQEKLIKYYEDIGCKNTDKLADCVNIQNNAYFLRPTEKGYISSGYGYRSFYLNGAPYSDFHTGLDVAGNAGGTNVYAAAAGTVAAVLYKQSCGGNQVFLHVRVNGVAYTIGYAHLLDVKVKVGDKVNNQTIIGTVGGGGKTLKSNGGWDTCSTGYHLHFVVATGFYMGGGSEGYTGYSNYVAHTLVPPFMPSYGKWYYSRR